VAEGDRAVEAAGRPGEKALRAAERALKRRGLGQREREWPKAGLVVEEYNRAHGPSLLNGSAGRRERREKAK
jgi:hypothetical protein